MYLQLNSISKSFAQTKKETLQNISLEVEKGEFICIVGPSGCGKSTLLNLVSGLDMPTEGTIYLDGQPITGPGADRVVMFQEAALYPWLNVMENVMFGLEAAGLGKAKQRETAEKYLRMVQLWNYREYPIHQISGGMKQRTALARALALDSKVLLMDEPFSALDFQTRLDVCDDVYDIIKKEHKTALLVTHDISEAIALADKVIVLTARPATVKEVHYTNLADIETPLKRRQSPDFSAQFEKLHNLLHG